MQLNQVISHEELFEAAPDGLVVVDHAGQIVQVNRQAEQLFGRVRAEIVGTMFGATLTGGSTVASPGQCVDLSLRTSTGEDLHVEATVGQAGDLNGCVVYSLRDVTGRRREEHAQRVRARQQAGVAELGRQALTGIDPGELMCEAITLVVTDLGVKYASLIELLPDGTATFRSGIGWPPGIVGETTTELAAGTPAGHEVQDQAPVVVADLQADNRFSGPSLARDIGAVCSLIVPLYGHGRPLGVLAIHSAEPRPFPDGDIHFVQAVANVVATAVERHRGEERLRERQMVRAEQMAAIGQVAAGVAHELRNPLTSVKGLVQVNLREADAQGLPTEDLQIIEHEVRRMERTLQTFLDFARPPKPDRRRLDLATVVDRVYALIGGRARKQGVALRCIRPNGPTWVDGDGDQLQQLMLNLLLNALDAMPHGGAVEVELRSPRDGLIELLVRDTGPGVAPQILPKVFETYVSDKETGIGIGLPVSRRIAEDHGGTLAANNLPAGGACFALRLPAPV